MLAGTWVFNAFYTRLPSWDAGSDIKYILVQFYLPRENVIAVWYSSMLLLMIAVVALLCFVVDHKNLPGRRKRTLTYGWVLTAMAFMALSLDEIGSLHERISMLSDWIPFDVSGWLIFLMIPIALFALFMSVFGWFRLRQNRWAFGLLILGVLLFISIPLQEQFEMALWHSAVDMDTWQRPVSHMLFEEGAELFGALSIFSGILVYLLAAFRGEGVNPRFLNPGLNSG